MSFARLLITVLVLVAALPVTASAQQDRRSPDVADASMQMLVQRDRTAPAPPPVVQDLRSPDARDVGVAPAPAQESPDAFPALEAGALGAFAVVLIGLTLVVSRRRRVAARA
jgi:hypothetical protein